MSFCWMLRPRLIKYAYGNIRYSVKTVRTTSSLASGESFHFREVTLDLSLSWTFTCRTINFTASRDFSHLLKSSRYWKSLLLFNKTPFQAAFLFVVILSVTSRLPSHSENNPELKQAIQRGRVECNRKCPY
jgi:hypothetical protein